MKLIENLIGSFSSTLLAFIVEQEHYKCKFWLFTVCYTMVLQYQN